MQTAEVANLALTPFSPPVTALIMPEMSASEVRILALMPFCAPGNIQPRPLFGGFAADDCTNHAPPRRK